jgi:3-oxoacyl-[acyl-carrier protein] reductase
VIALDFTGQHVLVVGGSAGIGLGIAKGFAQAGACVSLTGTRARDAYPDIPSDFAFHTLDDSDDAACKAFRADFADRPVDVLVCAVGTVRYRQAEFEIETFRQVMDVNLTGVFHLNTLFLDQLTQSAKEGKAGAIINIASLASFFSTINNPAYSASKGGLAILTKTLADKWGRQGVRVNGIAPGFVESKLTQVSRDNAAIYEGSLRKTPLGRWGTPDDMAGCALWLASPLASFVTGVTIPVDGGISLAL